MGLGGGGRVAPWWPRVPSFISCHGRKDEKETPGKQGDEENGGRTVREWGASRGASRSQRASWVFGRQACRTVGLLKRTHTGKVGQEVGELRRDAASLCVRRRETGGGCRSRKETKHHVTANARRHSLSCGHGGLSGGSMRRRTGRSHQAPLPVAIDHHVTL